MARCVGPLRRPARSAKRSRGALNRAVAVAEVRGPDTALEELKGLDDRALRGFLPYQVLRAELLRRTASSSHVR